MSSRDELLAVVEQSPAAVAAHDKASWVALFAEDGAVNDPVGSAPNVGHEAIGRFYETFIAPNAIVFHVDADIVCGRSVVRDLTVETQMGSGVTLKVPMHLRYDIDSDLKIAGLYAHWELSGMIRQLLKRGPKAVPVSMKLSGKLMKNQRLSGAIGFAKGFRGAGLVARELADVFFDTVTSGTNLGVAEAMLTDHPTLTIGEDRGTSLEIIGRRVTGFRIGKTLEAGKFVTASVSNGSDRGVILLQFARHEISAVKLYIND